MAKTNSSIDRVKAHLLKGKPAAAEVEDDVEVLLRRYERVRSLGGEHAQIELSPYMLSLLRLSPATAAIATSTGVRAAAGV